MLYLKAEDLSHELPANIVSEIKKQGKFTVSFPNRKFPENQIVYQYIGENIFKPDIDHYPILQLVGQKFVDITTKEEK